MIRTGISTITLAMLLAAPAVAQEKKAAPATGAATPAAADAFLKKATDEFTEFSIDDARIQWLYATYINDDTSALVAKSQAKGTEMLVGYALEASKFTQVKGLSPDTRRQLDILRSGITSPAPTRAGAAAALSKLQTDMQTVYGTGKGTLKGEAINGSDIEAAMGTNRNPAELKEMWTSWHDNVGAPQRADYQRAAGLLNEGARELGFKDVGAMWRSNYDMPPEEFAKLTDKLWNEVKPLYESLHTYVRWKLNEKYGDAVQSKTGPIRADLLGNMWGQEWGNIYDIVAPKGAGEIGYNIGDLLTKKGKTPVDMVRTGEGFYTSLGLPALPASFYERSQITRPRDRDVVCHASAWDVDNKEDLRIKMCTKVNSDDFVTIHHELGHNYYQRAYNQQSTLYQNGANDGFHEAIGDFIALSITPEYLVQIGLLDRSKVPGADKDIGLLLRQGMDKVAFMPFAYLVDKWRWGVFDGSVTPANYNQAWVDLKRQYQGIVPPVPRSENDFDPGAKFHIPGNTPYARYFLARVLQFQFYKAACGMAGWQGPLHRCSFYGNKQVGARLNQMLTMGASHPWPDALEAFTGTREISGKPMLEYFAPLQAWLEEQNRGKQCGW